MLLACSSLAILSAAPPAELHVSTTAAADGTTTFATVTAALARARELRGSRGGAAAAAGHIVINVGAGTFPAFALQPEDSGAGPDARTIIRGSTAAGAASVISGGVEVPAASFVASSDTAAWSVTTNSSIQPPVTTTCRAAPGASFRVRAVATGGAEDPRRGVCQQWQVPTQNLLEVSDDGGDDGAATTTTTWRLVTPLDCGNAVEAVSSATAATIYRADLRPLGLTADDVGTITANADCVHGCPDNMPALLSLGAEALVLARWPNANDDTGDNAYANAVSGGAGSLGLPLDGVLAPATGRVAGWAAAGDCFVHGYFEWDWADCYRKVTNATFFADATNTTAGAAAAPTTTLSFLPADLTPKPNARFYVLNALAELDAPGEFFLEREDSGSDASSGGRPVALHVVPPAGAGAPAAWVGAAAPTLALNTTVLDVSHTRHVTVEDLVVRDGRGVGVAAEGVVGLVLRNVTAHAHARLGIDVHNASGSTVSGCDVRDTGCAAIRAHGGFAASLTRGDLLVEVRALPLPFLLLRPLLRPRTLPPPSPASLFFLRPNLFRLSLAAAAAATAATAAAAAAATAAAAAAADGDGRTTRCVASRAGSGRTKPASTGRAWGTRTGTTTLRTARTTPCWAAATRRTRAARWRAWTASSRATPSTAAASRRRTRAPSTSAARWAPPS